jgi:hypothetical protein
MRNENDDRRGRFWGSDRMLTAVKGFVSGRHYSFWMSLNSPMGERTGPVRGGALLLDREVYQERIHLPWD